MHFRTKEDLAAAYLRRRTGTWRAHVEAEVQARADDPAGRVLALFDVFHVSYHRQCRLVQLCDGAITAAHLDRDARTLKLLV
ncbi:hypothetical protein ACTMTI_20140 [Nonomuraea sp. H19]|uniref:hypothetical protein n=1 Tax=Nonomuraea sp. H19 TaxID=3452206 RepID=UPI003F8BAD30